MSDSLVLAHISDLHLALPIRWHEVNRKRLPAWVNWITHRRLRHDPARLRAAVEQLVARPPDLLVVTGDLGQLGLTSEIRLAGEMLRPLHEKGVPILIASGNHDAYHQRDEDAREAFREVSEALRGDVEIDDAGIVSCGPLRLILFQQGVSTPIFYAWGALRPGILQTVRQRLPDDGVRIAAGHFALRRANGRRLPMAAGLHGDRELLDFLSEQHVDAYLCGHIHKAFDTPLGNGCTQHCAGSITTAHGRARYYRVDAGGVREIEPPLGAGE